MGWGDCNLHVHFDKASLRNVRMLYQQNPNSNKLDFRDAGRDRNRFWNIRHMIIQEAPGFQRQMYKFQQLEKVPLAAADADVHIWHTDTATVHVASGGHTQAHREGSFLTSGCQQGWIFTECWMLERPSVR